MPNIKFPHETFHPWHGIYAVRSFEETTIKWKFIGRIFARSAAVQCIVPNTVLPSWQNKQMNKQASKQANKWSSNPFRELSWINFLTLTLYYEHLEPEFRVEETKPAKIKLNLQSVETICKIHKPPSSDACIVFQCTVQYTALSIEYREHSKTYLLSKEITNSKTYTIIWVLLCIKIKR